ncbi:MAG: class I SAM-dependent methyltransferase [Acidimicrobiales bacterium]
MAAESITPSLRHAAVRMVRHGLQVGAGRPQGRRLLEIAGREMKAALTDTPLDGDDFYGADYFAGGGELDRLGLSGYAKYDRVSSLANVIAYMLWLIFPASAVLDVGCALGFVVEALRDLGFDARGVDISQYAVEHAGPARPFLQQANLITGLPFDDGRFPLVTALETLEHLSPQAIPQVLKELRRVTSGYLVATIPSFGPNEYRPDGWFSGKVSWDRLDYYDALDGTYDGPVPYEDLLRDLRGHPIQGHLTIASFRWWTQQFQAAGFERCGQLEERLYPDVDRLGRTGWWNLYVMRVPGVDLPPPELRQPDEIAEVEERWALDQHQTTSAD